LVGVCLSHTRESAADRFSTRRLVAYILPGWCRRGRRGWQRPRLWPARVCVQPGLHHRGWWQQAQRGRCAEDLPRHRQGGGGGLVCVVGLLLPNSWHVGCVQPCESLVLLLRGCRVPHLAVLGCAVPWCKSGTSRQARWPAQPFHSHNAFPLPRPGALFCNPAAQAGSLHLLLARGETESWASYSCRWGHPSLASMALAGLRRGPCRCQGE